MYNIVNDVATLITTSSQKDRFPDGPHIKKPRASSQLAKLGQLTCFKSLRSISVMVVRKCMNIPKYTLIGYISLSNGFTMIYKPK